MELLGEVGDWLTGLPMHEESPGVYARSAELPEGVYAYKVKVDGAWTLPPGVRTRGRDGHRNALASIGGAPEPCLFAAAPPWVVAADRGGLVVTAGLRRGAGEAMRVAWREAGEERVAPMARWIDEDEHVLFRAEVPASAARTELALLLDDGRRVEREDGGGPFVHLRPPAADDLPAWWRQGVVYAVLVDRFRGASDDGWGPDPGRGVAAGGHLDGVRRALPDLDDLGVTVLYLTPIHVGASCHRYDLVDPLVVDPRLGGEEAFARLVAAAHARGMRILVDFSFAHAGPGFPPYEDVRARGRASAYASWFHWKRDGLRCYGRRTDAPLLDLDCPEVRRMVLETAERWAARQVDGLRLDMAAEFPLDLARQVRRVLRQARPEAIVVGEVVAAHAWRWREEHAVDAATDFGGHGALVDLFARASVDVPTALERLRASEADRGGGDAAAMRFVSTHDHTRLSTLARAVGNEARARLATLFLFTWPGVPMLLYGEEIGLCARVAALEPENVWPDRLPMRWARTAEDEAVRARVRTVVRARRQSRALTEGDLEVLHAAPDVLIYRRAAAGEVVDVALNLGAAAQEVEIADDARPAMEVLATVGEVNVKPPRLGLGAFSGVAIARRTGERVASARRLRVLDASGARDRAMAARAPESPALPGRIFFALSELCNVRCAHCITHAPEKTRTGQARSLTPRLLDALRPALGYARYFAFTHGGEPMIAPAFEEALEAIREARAGAPYVAHLLTNGMLLGAQRAERLARAGISSISVSLDGASAEVNDAVRVGTRLDQIAGNLREVVRLRAEQRLDLRLGISLVVMRENVEELTLAVELAHEIGVDWLKLEELVPATAFATRSLVHGGARDAISRAIARGAELGLPVVDHTRERTVWRCKLDPETAAFLAGDELANRSEIHPCRAPWEDACIAPNGDVRLVDFFGPLLGSLAQAPFEELWNGDAARAARRAAAGSRLCGSGPVVCLHSGQGFIP